MRLSQTKTDPTLERDGVWVAIRYGVEVKVARAGNPRAEAWRARLAPEDRRLLDNPSLFKGREERIIELLTDAIAETMLLDWRGVEDDDGEPLPYSPAEGKKAMQEYDWLRDDVHEAATTRETFFRLEVEEVGKHSRKSSAGKGATPKG